jgi:hypothetical protein
MMNGHREIPRVLTTGTYGDIKKDRGWGTKFAFVMTKYAHNTVCTPVF